MRCLIFTLAPRASIGESQGLNWYRLGVARLPWRSIEIGGARVAGLDGCCHDVPLVDFSWETFPIDGGRGHQTFQADRKSTRLNSRHAAISYAAFCCKEK